MRSTLCFLFLLVCASVNAQTTVVTKGEIRLGLEVYDYVNEKYLDISKISSGFDQEGLPINLVLPNKTQIQLWLPDVGESNADQYRIIDQGKVRKIERFDKEFEGRMVASLGNISYSPGSYDAIYIVELSNRKPILDSRNTRLMLEWKTDEEDIELVAFIQNDEIDERQIYTDSIMGNLFSSSEIIKGYDYWLKQGFAQSLDENGLPENPVIPRGSGIISFATNAPDVSLYRDGEKIPFDRFESRPYGASSVYYFKPDRSGNYIIRMADPRKVYGETTRSYSFSVPFNFWQEGGYYMLGGIGLLGIFFLVYRINAKRKVESAELNSLVSQAELKAVRSQLNPHFLFNALNAIQNLVNQNENDQANGYIVKLSRLMRRVLNQSDENFHSLESELSLCQLYIDLEKLRKHFEFELQIASSIDQNMLVPNMILQPYLENAVLHGVHHNGADFINLSIKEKDDSLFFSISNNGKQARSNIEEGQGMTLGRQRLEIINQQYGKGSASVKTQIGIELFTVEVKLPKNL